MAPKQLLNGLLLAALALTPAACRKSPEAADAPPDAGPQPAVGTEAPPDNDSDPEAVSTTGLSHFDAVVAQTDLGGEVFIYRELEGSAAEIAKVLDELTALGQSALPAGEAPEIDIDFPALFDDLGLTRIDAIGLSSMRKGAGYTNKFYIHAPGGRRGILRMLGRDAAPFESRTIAPVGTDLLIERELNLSEVYRVGRDLIKRLKDPAAERSWAAMMGQGVANLGVTVGDLFQKLDTRLIVIGRLHPNETLEIPGPNGPIELPKFDLFVSLDGVGLLFDQLVKRLPEEAADALEKAEGYEQLNLPPNPLMQGVLRKDSESGRIVFASSPEFMARCTNGQGGLYDSPGFKAATAGLPKEGNGIVFMSKNFGKQVENVWISALGSSGLEGDQVTKGMALVAKLAPVLRSRYAQVSANLPDGVLTASNSPVSLKHSVAAVPAAFLVAGVASFKTVSVVAAEGVDVRVRADLRTLQVALVQYKLSALSFPTTAQGLKALIEAPEGVRNWEGPYLADEILDPWGSPYQYRYPGVADGGKPELFSSGPDGRPNTGDDLTAE